MKAPLDVLVKLAAEFYWKDKRKRQGTGTPRFFKLAHPNPSPDASDGGGE